MGDTDEYLLGHGEREWDRLREQHALWGPVLLDDLRTAGVGPGTRVLEVGCGAGDLLADLAELTGAAEGLERDPDAAAHAIERLAGRADVRTADLLPDPLGGPFDAIVARWVLSFLGDPTLPVARMAEALAPGGLLAVHDYDHDGLGVYPPHPAIQRAIEAIRAKWRQMGGDLWVVTKLPAACHAAGLEQVQVLPHAKAGGPLSAVWRWVGRFLHEHIHTVVASGHLSKAECEAFFAAWVERASDPDSLLMSPLQVTVLARKTSMR